ncbi:MAG: T9SS type A sorting domain-containing protein [candidate division WOR-3 bacterium]
MLSIKFVYPDPYVDETWLGSGNEYCQFVIISDPHIGIGFSDYSTPGWNDSPPDVNNEGYSAAILRAVCNWINAHRISERIRFVIITGDLTQSAEISEMKKAEEILNTLQVPWIPLIGNHDVWPYTDGTSAPEELSDSYFNNIFDSQYQYLVSALPNFTKCPTPVWNWEVDPDHNSYFQDFAFDYPTGNKIWHFICLDFNARDNAPAGLPGVAPEADLHKLDMDNKISSIRVYNSDSRGVILYDGASPSSWEGKSEVFFSNDADLGSNWIGNDCASSIRIVGNCTVRLHKDVDYKGSIVKTSTSISNLGSSSYNFNDKASSIAVSNGALHGHLVVYEDIKRGGHSEIFIASDHYLTGNYIGNDKISSFEIWGPCKVTFYKDVNFGGDALSYDVSSGDYLYKESMPSGWNDRVSSIKIENCNSRGVILYEDVGIDNNNNPQLTLCFSDKDLGNNTPEFNDDASAIKIVGNCTATLFVDVDYKGYLEATGPGFYKLSDYNLNNEVSSIEVVNGYKNGRVELYRDESYGGSKEIFIYDDNNLDYNFIANNTASSVKIYPGASGCYARLYSDSYYGGNAYKVTENDPRLSENGAYAWWRDHLRNYPNKGDENILIFAHHPLHVQPTHLFSADEYNQVSSLLYNYKNSINAWFSGHYHDGQYSWGDYFEWNIEYQNQLICKGYFVGANCNEPHILLVKLRYTLGAKNYIAQSDIPEATGYNNARRLIRDASGSLHLAFTSGDSVYHTFLQDTSWSEPVLIGEGKYPAVCTSGDNLYAIFAYNSNSPLFLEELRLAKKVAAGWMPSSMPLARTYNSFLWGVGAPSLAIKDTIGYFVFESTFGPTYHSEPGGPFPQVITLQGTALIYGQFPLNHPENCQWQILEELPWGPIPIPFDTIVYKDSILPMLISPSIAVDGDGVVHILWEGRGDSLRYYRIIDTVITREFCPSSGIDYPFITMRDDQIDHIWCEGESIKYRYGWTGTENLSQTQTVATCESPISSGQYLTWTKRIGEMSNLYYGAIPSSGLINPILVTSSENLIKYPQILFNQNPPSIDLVWTEYNMSDSVGYIYYCNLPLTEVAPKYAFDMGTEVPVPILVQRDGFITYGTEDFQTVDYDSTELIYHLTLHSPHTKYKIRWTWYHEETDKIHLQFNIDDIFHRNRWVNPNEKVVEEGWIPDACVQDNEITIKVKVLNGTIAVLSGFEIYNEEVGGGGPQGGEAQIARPFYFDRIYPNPTRGMIRIRFNSPDKRKVTIKIYDVAGRLVHQDEIRKSRIGINEVLIKPAGLSSGVYFVWLSAKDYKKTEKIIYLR